MKEQLISYETAKLAKEVGFNISSEYTYNIEGKIMFAKYDYSSMKDIIYAPTQNLLRKWLREEHYVDIHILTQKPKYCGYTVEGYIINPKETTHKYFGLKEEENNNKFEIYNSYEDALEEALYKILLIIK